MFNALTLDLEPWYENEFVRKYTIQEKKDQVEISTTPILELLDKYNTKATFFVLGSVAEEHPETVRTIFEEGHEIASHAYSHKTLYELSKGEFEEEIKKSVSLLESITGEKPIGFRAPTFSINQSTRWAFEILVKYGFKYDSSIFPMKTRQYGVPKAPLHIYRPSMQDIAKEDPSNSLVEFPVTVLNLGINIPVAGGFYLRILPSWFLKFAITRINKTRPAVIYIHPWETYPGTPRPKNIPVFSRFVVYHGIHSALRKLEGLVNEFKFQPIREMLDEVFSGKLVN